MTTAPSLRPRNALSLSAQILLSAGLFLTPVSLIAQTAKKPDSSVSATGPTISEAIKLLKEKRTHQAILTLEKMAATADPGSRMQAKNLLGHLYETSSEVGQNDRTALQWYRSALEENSRPAMYRIGFFYENGRAGLAQDYDQARQWYLKSANLEFPPAMVAIGRMLRDGLGMPNDSTKAIEYFSRAAKAGDASGYFEQAKVYLMGLAHAKFSAPEQAPPLKQVSHQLLERGMRAGYRPAKYYLENCANAIDESANPKQAIDRINQCYAQAMKALP